MSTVDYVLLVKSVIESKYSKNGILSENLVAIVFFIYIFVIDSKNKTTILASPRGLV